jgi:transposase
MSVKVIGLDMAKHVFQVHGADGSGKAVLRKRLRRNQLTDFFGSIPRCVIGMEATRGAHYWARVLGSFGHEVKLIAPQFVKPYVKGQKNDSQDAAAICEAVSRPEMRFVPRKQSSSRIYRHYIASEAACWVAGHNWVIRFAGCSPNTGSSCRFT